MMSVPDPYESIIVLFMALLFYVIPVTLAVVLLVSHIKIHSGLKQIRKLLEQKTS